MTPKWRLSYRCDFRFNSQKGQSPESNGPDVYFNLSGILLKRMTPHPQHTSELQHTRILNSDNARNKFTIDEIVIALCSVQSAAHLPTHFSSKHLRGFARNKKQQEGTIIHLEIFTAKPTKKKQSASHRFSFFCIQSISEKTLSM